MFNIINFSKSKSGKGVNVKLSQFIPEEDGSDGGCWESVYIYIPFDGEQSQAAQNTVVCNVRKKTGDLYIKIPAARKYVKPETKKPNQTQKEEEENNDFPF